MNLCEGHRASWSLARETWCSLCKRSEPQRKQVVGRFVNRDDTPLYRNSKKNDKVV